VVGAGFSLEDVEDVQYVSPTDATAQLSNCSKPLARACTTVVATTQDNWAHATGIAIPDTLAGYVSHTPMGHGAVAIEAEVEPSGRKYPPFVLYPNGEATPLSITREPRALDVGSDLVCTSYACDFLYEAGADDESWAADVDAAEIYPVPGVPDGDLWEHVPDRGGAVLSVLGEHRTAGGETWRFAESTDNTRTWRMTDVQLPTGGKPRWLTPDVDHSEEDVVGPGHLQAIAWTDAPLELDLPQYLRELWRTDDENTFHRVPLPWRRMPAGGLPFAGMVFASDGALLLAEANGSPRNLCPGGRCHPGRIWRLPAGMTEMKPLAHAPRPAGPVGLTALETSGGGMIVALTGPRTIAVSRDGYTWTTITPGR
jgi:hypothetical protein